MSKKVAVILAGCGYLDGAEIRESVLSLLYLDENNADVKIFAPDKDQHHVINHLNGEEVANETRNVLIESARIARGDISPLSDLNASDFDALILPGGFGVAKNCSTLAFDGADMNIDEEYKKAINDFYDDKKPIGAICISPAILVASLKAKTKTKVTVGEEENNDLIESLGGTHTAKRTDDIEIDNDNNIVSTSAYMRDDARISDVSKGIENLVKEILERIN
jgi:enhancing lycopene biosynthesis protein 2